ncbi:PIR protein, fragment [Plasmodium vivax]|uniref:VIR protein n=1 Tax=Plasmodium vivax TaxID=5855 RepID=A0A565A774_PLAVI|nr:PIR protein, fragment [Plasmodium vivax]
MLYSNLYKIDPNASHVVDPIPVVGVSGGMGALFLLFRYTPVGSFFGGRRGRFRQIPRSFNGPFPGDFANFQEYDGGFIGYGPMNPQWTIPRRISRI